MSRHEDDICEECGAEFDSKAYISEPDGCEEYWGAIVSRPEVVTGYECPECGHKGNF